MTENRDKKINACFESVRNAGRGIPQAVLDLVYPRTCVVCGAAGDSLFPDGIAVCPDCRAIIVTDSESLCPKCSGSRWFNEYDHGNCRSCRPRSFLFKRVLAFGPYEEPLRRIVLSMKRERFGTRATELARLFVRARARELEAIAPTLVIPVPSHFLRRLIRGTNSAETIGQEVAKEIGIPFAANLVRRIRATRPQAELKKNDRWMNVAGAFRVEKARRFSFSRRWNIVGERILLTDDVLTTGATANEIARILREAGAHSVHVAVFVRAEGIKGLSPEKKRRSP